MSRYNRCKECYNIKCVFVTAEREDFDTSECQDFRPMTNADRIRQMTDEELAELLVMRDLSCVIKFNEALGSYAHLHYDKESSIKSVLNWLKEGTKENES